MERKFEKKMNANSTLKILGRHASNTYDTEIHKSDSDGLLSVLNYFSSILQDCENAESNAISSS